MFTGESYAGIYIPEIMNAIDKRGTLNLKGAAIGDGTTCLVLLLQYID